MTPEQLRQAREALERYEEETGGEPFAAVSSECARKLADALRALAG